MGAYSSSSSNDSKNASATILNCESSNFSPPLRGRAFPSNGHETMLLPSRSLGSLLRVLSRGLVVESLNCQHPDIRCSRAISSSLPQPLSPGLGRRTHTATSQPELLPNGIQY